MSIDQKNLIKALTILGVAGPEGMEDCAASQENFVNCLTSAVIRSQDAFQQMIWQPIKSAPKNGYFLVKFNDYGEEYICSCFRSHGGDFEFNGRGHVECNKPVSWMQIPK